MALTQGDLDAARTLADDMLRVDGDRDHMNPSALKVEQTVCAAEALRALADAVEPDLMSEADHRAVLEMAGKRPVAFRVHIPADHGPDHRLFSDEAEAAAFAESCNTDYQGLYVRDGT